MSPLTTPLVMTVAVLASPAGAAAGTRPVPVVEYRQAVMKALAAHQRAITLLGGGTVALADQAVLHAAAIKDLAGTLVSLFPPGSGPDAARTEALESVWTDAAGFRASAEKLQAESAALLRASQGRDRSELPARAEAVAKACTACHDVYRRQR